MYKKLFLSLIIASLLLWIPHYSYAEQQEKPPLTMSIVAGYDKIIGSLVGQSIEDRRKSGREKPDFYVFLNNVSDKPVKLWHWICNGDETNLSFELSINNKNYIIKSGGKECQFDANVNYIIEPHQAKTFEINISGGYEFDWPYSALKVDTITSATIKASYNFTIDVPENSKMGRKTYEYWVWEGVIESEPLNIVIYP